MRKSLALLILVLSSNTAFAGDLRVTLADRGAITLNVPTGWIERVSRSKPDIPPTIHLLPKSGKSFEVLVTPIRKMPDNAKPATSETVRASVKKSADDAKSQAVEKEIVVVDFKGSSGFGSYFSATDRAPEPGGYKYLTQGIMVDGDVSVAFTILANGDPTPIVKQALEVIKTARLDRGESGK